MIRNESVWMMRSMVAVECKTIRVVRRDRCVNDSFCGVRGFVLVDFVIGSFYVFDYCADCANSGCYR
jgi:hypothetical protein